MSGEPGPQGTQMDAHRAFCGAARAVGRQGRIPGRPRHAITAATSRATSSPRPTRRLQKLGIEKVPPIVTTAVLLDAKTYLGKGKAMKPGAGCHRQRTSRRC